MQSHQNWIREETQNNLHTLLERITAHIAFPYVEPSIAFKEFRDAVIPTGDDINTLDEEGNTLLHRSVFIVLKKRFGSHPLNQVIERWRELVNLGADFSIRNKAQMTPMDAFFNSIIPNFRSTHFSDKKSIEQCIQALLPLLKKNNRADLWLSLPSHLENNITPDKVEPEFVAKFLKKINGFDLDAYTLKTILLWIDKKFPEEMRLQPFRETASIRLQFLERYPQAENILLNFFKKFLESPNLIIRILLANHQHFPLKALLESIMDLIEIENQAIDSAVLGKLEMIVTTLNDKLSVFEAFKVTQLEPLDNIELTIAKNLFEMLESAFHTNIFLFARKNFSAYAPAISFQDRYKTKPIEDPKDLKARIQEVRNQHESGFKPVLFELQRFHTVGSNQCFFCRVENHKKREKAASAAENRKLSTKK